jgi:polysaccharide export outer membrane protein
MSIFGRVGRLVFGTALGGAVTACGVVYTSPAVRDQGAGFDVSVVALTSDTVQMANRSVYNPRNMPAYFYQAAGTATPDLPALPDAPYIPEELRETVTLSPPPGARHGPYRIGVGDEILLATKRNSSSVEQLTGLLAAQNSRQGYTVRDDGAIAIPEVGSVQIAGLSIEEAESRLFEALLQNQMDPTFSLEISEFNSQRVVVGGAVRSDVIVPIKLDALRLSEAIATAGGVTIRDKEFAVIRLYREGKLYQIPVVDYLGSMALQHTELQNGDAVYVDTTYDLDRALEFYRENLNVIALRTETREQALRELMAEIQIRRNNFDEKRSNFRTREEFGANQRDFVYVTGEVKEQSRFTMPYNVEVTLADVLYDQGGFPVVTGDASEIYVLRAAAGNGSGRMVAWHLDANNIANLSVATRMKMRPNDVIFVEEQVITKWSRALAQTLPTLINLGAASVIR